MKFCYPPTINFSSYLYRRTQFLTVELIFIIRFYRTPNYRYPFYTVELIFIIRFYRTRNFHCPFSQYGCRYVPTDDRRSSRAGPAKNSWSLIGWSRPKIGCHMSTWFSLEEFPTVTTRLKKFSISRISVLNSFLFLISRKMTEWR